MIIVFLLAVFIILLFGVTPTIALFIRIIKPNRDRLFKRSLLIGVIITFIYVGAISLLRTYNFDLLRYFYYYLGFVSVGFYIAIVYRIIDRSTKKRFSVIPYIILIVAVCIYGVWNFHRPTPISIIDIVSEKITSPVTFALLGDIQYGSSTRAYMEKVIQTVNQLESDYIFFVGDLIDFDEYNREDFAVFDTLRVPLYFVTGNHEYYHESTRILRYLADYENIIVLDDETVLLDDYNVSITGLDYKHHNLSTFEDAVTRLTPDPDQFAIFLNHIPEKVELTAQTGFDLLLYGHTHGGQLFPYNYLVKAIYKYGVGKSTLGESIVYTTSGAGLRGPRMRVGTNNEIVLIRLSPAGQSQ